MRPHIYHTQSGVSSVWRGEPETSRTARRVGRTSSALGKSTRRSPRQRVALLRLLPTQAKFPESR